MCWSSFLIYMMSFCLIQSPWLFLYILVFLPSCYLRVCGYICMCLTVLLRKLPAIASQARRPSCLVWCSRTLTWCMGAWGARFWSCWVSTSVCLACEATPPRTRKQEEGQDPVFVCPAIYLCLYQQNIICASATWQIVLPSLLCREQLFMDMIDRMAADGFKAAGYELINIDVWLYECCGEHADEK